MKKIISVLLCILLLASLLPVSAFADTTASGTCGDNLTWTLDSNGTLTISGTGEMEDWGFAPDNGDYKTAAPWGECYSSIKIVAINDGVTSIGLAAFFGCSSLTSVTIPDSVTSIGDYAFEGCSNIENVYYNGDIDSWLRIDFKSPSSNPCYNESDLYFNGELATDVVILDSVTSIGDNAFWGCTSLASVTMLDGVTSIGEEAFWGCSSLTSVVIPDSVTSIGDWAFCGCNSLTSITIPASITSIGDWVFCDCSSLTSVTIPDSVTSIGEAAFSGCSSLTSVVIPDGVTSVGQIAFSDCTSLISATMPDSVASIAYGAFLRCSSLTDITVDDNNQYYCSDDGVLFNKDKTELHTYPAGKSNTSYIVPSSVTSIGAGTFWECNNLEKVTIPDSVTSLGNSAFWGCSNLTSITIPASVTSIGDYAFEGCDSLTDVYYGGNAAQWKSITIGEDNEPLLNATIHYDYVAAPAAPVIKITTSAGKPKISWSKVDGATKYKVYRSTNGKTYKLYTTVTSASYTDKNAKIGTTYYYKVKAVNSNGAESVFSNAKNIKCRPATPTVSISRVSGKAKLSWKAISGATKYWVYRSTDGKNYTRVISTTKLSYTDSKSKSGTKYYYKVQAIAVVNNTNVGSAFSAIKTITTTLAKPTVKITTSNGKPKLSWSKVTGADKYYIYRSTDGKTFKYYTSTTKLTYTNTGAKKGTKYYYKVKAVRTADTKANSAYSAVVSIKATK